MTSKELRKITREAWQQKVEAFKQTSQTALEWCKENNIEYKSFLRWRRKFELESNPNTTCHQVFKEIVDLPPNHLIIELNQYKVHVPQNFSKHHLLACLQALGGISC
jgi:hypothetical protein